MSEIVEKEDRPLRTILDDVAGEMAENLILIEDVINALYKDTYITTKEDEDGKKIHDTYIHPDLLNWVKEKRMSLKEMWKIAGGELQQEKEKEEIKIKGKMILETISSMDPNELKEKKKQWKKNYDARNND